MGDYLTLIYSICVGFVKCKKNDVLDSLLEGKQLTTIPAGIVLLVPTDKDRSHWNSKDLIGVA